MFCLLAGNPHSNKLFLVECLTFTVKNDALADSTTLITGSGLHAY